MRPFEGPPWASLPSVPPASVASLAPARLTTHDVEALALASRPWERAYTQLTPGSFEGRMARVPLGELTVVGERFGPALAVVGAPPQGTRSVSALLGGHGETRWRGAAARAGDLLVTHPGREWFARTAPGAEVWSATLGPATLQRHAERLGAGDPDEALRERWLLPGPRSLGATRLRRLLQRVARLAHLPSVEDAQAVLENELLDALVGVAEELRTRGTASPGSAFRRRTVLRATAWLREARPRTPTVADLCAVTGASARSLELAFREAFDTTPVRYLKHLRLGAVRQRLLEARGLPPATAPGVTDLAGEHGFWDAGHFARDYRSLFGELPSETLGLRRAPSGSGPLDARSSRRRA